MAYVTGETNLSDDETLEAFDELKGAELIEYDETTETVLDRVALRHNPIKNGIDKNGEPKPDNRLAGALKQLDQVTDSPLLERFAALASRYSPDLGFAIYEKHPYLQTPDKALSSPSQGPSLGRPSLGASKGRVEKRREEQLREESENESEDHHVDDPEGFEAFKAARDRLAEAFNADVVEERVR